jgi:hypothetical protein
MRSILMSILGLASAFCALGCADEDKGETAGDESGMLDGGGECDQEFELLSRSDERNGVTAQTVVTEFFGTFQVSLDWMADDDGPQTVSFTERGTQTVLSLRVETSDDEEVRWYSGGGTGATGCAPRMAIGATLGLETEDGALDETVSVWFERFALPDGEELEVQAAIQFELGLSSLQGSLDVETADEIELESVRGLASFDAERLSSGYFSVPVLMKGEGRPLVTGQSIDLARW